MVVIWFNGHLLGLDLVIVTLVAVAGNAGSNSVFERSLSTHTDRKNVVQSSCLFADIYAAVNATEAIT